MITVATAMCCAWCELPLVTVAEGEGFILAESDQCQARYAIDAVLADRAVLDRGKPWLRVDVTEQR